MNILFNLRNKLNNRANTVLDPGNMEVALDQDKNQEVNMGVPLSGCLLWMFQQTYSFCSFVHCLKYLNCSLQASSLCNIFLLLADPSRHLQIHLFIQYIFFFPRCESSDLCQMFLLARDTLMAIFHFLTVKGLWDD